MSRSKEKLSRFVRAVNVEFNLTDVAEILKGSEKYDMEKADNVKGGVVDNFLYSGRFNSVLGPDGFGNFKDSLKDVVKKVNAGDFGANYINIDKMFETLLVSGVYYNEEFTPEGLEDMKGNDRWLTAYRYVAKNFPDITYPEFREVVTRFKDSRGYSIYIEESDSPFLLKMAENSRLFTFTVDVKASLLHLNMKSLREICEKVGVQPGRSLEETADRIIAKAGEEAKTYLPTGLSKRKTLVIRDQELATGHDIIQLDSYLRTIAKIVRDDFVDFVNNQRFVTLIA